MLQSTKELVYRNLNADENNKLGRSIDTAIIVLIAISIVAVILESDRDLEKDYRTAFVAFEWFSSILFSIEYVLRVWTCTCDERYAHPIKGRLRYVVSPMALVDLVAILPFYLTFIKGLDLRVVRAIRLLRLFRLFKIGRYAEAFRQLSTVFSSKKEDLAITFFVMMLMLVMASSVMFFAENEAQPDKFHSIPSAMWWGVATLTTVGYGDVFPITPIGKFFGAIIALLGVGIVAMPAGIIAGGFNEALQERKDQRRQQARQQAQQEQEKAQKEAEESGVMPVAPAGACVCPHCHKPIVLAASAEEAAAIRAGVEFSDEGVPIDG